MWFEAYPKSHFVTVSNYINSLADYTGRSTIKTLPATFLNPLGVTLANSERWGLYPKTGGRGQRGELRGPRTLDIGLLKSLEIKNV